MSGFMYHLRVKVWVVQDQLSTLSLWWKPGGCAAPCIVSRPLITDLGQMRHKSNHSFPMCLDCATHLSRFSAFFGLKKGKQKRFWQKLFLSYVCGENELHKIYWTSEMPEGREIPAGSTEQWPQLWKKDPAKVGCVWKIIWAQNARAVVGWHPSLPCELHYSIIELLSSWLPVT